MLVLVMADVVVVAVAVRQPSHDFIDGDVGQRWS